MEEQAAWKGHAFTLMIFVGIVVLCSIFFVLGMLVGRTQSIKMAGVTTAEAASKSPLKEKPSEDVTDRDRRFDNSPPRIKPAPTPAPPVEAPVVSPVPDPPAQEAPITLNIQVTALSKQAEAEKLVYDLHKKGFKAFVLTPVPNDPAPLYRVQVGATDSIDAESIKQKLEAAGFKPMVVKPR